MQVFGADASTMQRPDQMAALSVEPVRPNELSRRVNSVVAEIRRGRPTRPSLYTIRQGRSPLLRRAITPAISVTVHQLAGLRQGL